MNAFKRGARETLPLMLGLAPFGMLLGAQAVQNGLSVTEIVLIMLLNFAGGSEFAAVNNWATPIPVVLILLMTFMINSRHIVMGAALAPLIKHLPMKKILPLLFFMTDESWAMAMSEAQKEKRVQLNVGYYFGVALSLYLMWASSGLLGGLFGSLIGDIRHLGFEMTFPAVFLVLIRSMWKGWHMALPLMVSLVSAGVSYVLLPNNGAYVIIGTLCGLLVSYFSQPVSQPPRNKKGAQK